MSVASTKRGPLTIASPADGAAYASALACRSSTSGAYGDRMHKHGHILKDAVPGESRGLGRRAGPRPPSYRHRRRRRPSYTPSPRLVARVPAEFDQLAAARGGGACSPHCLRRRAPRRRRRRRHRVERRCAHPPLPVWQLYPKLQRRRVPRDPTAYRARAQNDRATVSTSIKNGRTSSGGRCCHMQEASSSPHAPVRLFDEPAPGTDDALSAILHGGDSRSSRQGQRAGCRVVASPSSSSRRRGAEHRRGALQGRRCPCRALDFRYMLFARPRRSGSWSVVASPSSPPDVLPGLDRASSGTCLPTKRFIMGVGLQCRAVLSRRSISVMFP